MSPWRYRHGLGAIGDVARGRAIPGQIVLLDAPPLLPLPVESIDVEHHTLAGQAWDPRHCTGADVEEEADVVALRQGVHGGEETVRDGVEMLAPEGRELDQTHPAI